MAAIDAFGDAALDADLDSILGLGADRVVPTGRSRSSVNLSRYRTHAILFLVTVTMLAIVGTLRFNQPKVSSDRTDPRPATVVPTSRQIASGTSRTFAAAPVMDSDAVVVSTTPDSVAPPVAATERRSLTKVASVLRPSLSTADVPAGAAIAPVADDGISQRAVEIPSPAPLSVSNDGQAVSLNNVAIVVDPTLPSAEQSNEEVGLKRSRRDSVSAIRSLRRQF